METKKSPYADLEKERTIYFLMGFIVVLSSFFVLMEWESRPPDSSDWQNLTPVFVESELIGNIETPKASEEIIPEKIFPEIIYEDYQVVEEILPSKEVVVDSLLPAEEKQIEIPTVKEPEIPDELDRPDLIYTEAEVTPQYPGGIVELIRFIYEHIQYPSAALKQRIQGRVWCSFIVNKDGSVSDVQLEKGVYVFLDDEAIRVLELMPSWIPGRKDDKPVRMKVYIPIVFKY